MYFRHTEKLNTVQLGYLLYQIIVTLIYFWLDWAHEDLLYTKVSVLITHGDIGGIKFKKKERKKLLLIFEGLFC